MKIRFLGTSHGVPMPGRHYQSILLEVNDKLYIFDAGAPVMDELLNGGYDVNKVHAAFITHVHQDHMFGLVNVVNLASWYYTKMQFEIFIPEQRGIDAIENYNEIMLLDKTSDKISYTVVEEGTIFDDGNIKVTAVPNEHMYDTTNISYSYLVEAEGKRVYITGDLHPTLKDFPSEELSQKTDVVITECAHFPAEDLIEKIKNVNADKVMVIHVFTLDKYDVLGKYKETAPFELLFPNDGDEYIIS